MNDGTPGGTPDGDGDAGEGGASPNWLDGLDDENREFVEKNGYPDINAALKSSRETAKLIGVDKDRLVRWPEKGLAEDPEAYAGIMARLGVPDAAAEDAFKSYEIDGVEGVFSFADDAEREAVQKGMLELGLRPDQATGLLENVYAPLMKAQAERDAAAADAAAREAEASLREEWGAAYDQNLALAADAELSLPESFSDFLVEKGLNNHPEMVRLLAKVGAGIEEGSLKGGSRDGDNAGGRGKKITREERDSLLGEFERRHGEALESRNHPQHAWAVKERMEIMKRATA